MAPAKTSPAKAASFPRRAPRSAGEILSHRRHKRYSRDLKGLARFLWEQGRTLTHATEKDAAAWIRSLYKKAGAGSKPSLSPAVFRKIASARAFFERLKQVTAVLNPFARFRTRRSDRPVEPPLSLGSRDLKRLLATMNPDSPWGLRNRAITLLRFGASLSVSDICRLKRTQVIVDRRGPAIRLARTGGTVLRIPLRGPVLSALRKHLKRNRPKGPYLFQVMPASLAAPSSGTRGKRGNGKPLSARWVATMLAEARLVASR
jgi:site-specific recombinase XerD